jgi:hypothetical protein
MSWCIGSRAAYKKVIANRASNSNDRAGLSGQISQKRETSMTRTSQAVLPAALAIDRGDKIVPLAKK